MTRIKYKIQSRKIQRTGFILSLAIFVALPLNALWADAPTRPKTLIALGDSLTAGFMLPPSQGFVAQLQSALRARGHNVTIIDAGVSGDTSAGGLSRLNWVLPEDGRAIDGMIIELGANDALRAIPPRVTRANLDAIIKIAKQRDIPILLAGMYAPLGLSQDYQNAFNRIYPDLAAAHKLLLYPFFLDGVAANPKLNLADGIHPNAEGIKIIIDKILPSVENLLTQNSKGI